MYKIYINNIPFAILPPDSTSVLSGEVLKLHYPGKRKFLLNVVDQLEKTNRWDGIEMRAQTPEVVWEEFQKLFTIVPAAGGLIRNDRNEILFIFRRGYWDLPKGKVDNGETFQQAALREAQEETGLSGLKLGPELTTTWHTYRQNGQRFLKPTHWFEMYSTSSVVKLQHEEDIERAEWMALDAVLNNPPTPIYKAIMDVVRAAAMK